MRIGVLNGRELRPKTDTGGTELLILTNKRNPLIRGVRFWKHGSCFICVRERARANVIFRLLRLDINVVYPPGDVCGL